MTASGRFRVLAWPAVGEKHGNPYVRLLYNAVRRCDPTIIVEEFTPRALFRPYNGPTIWHMHWPESTTGVRSRARALRNLALFRAIIRVARIRGWCLVWTIHNVMSHDRRHPVIERWLMRSLVRNIDGAISLSRAGSDAALRMYPALSGRPVAHIPHGHYADAYPNSVDRAQARAELGVDADCATIVMFGQLRPYKNVLNLMRVFSEMEHRNARLFIAGAAVPREFASDVIRESRRDPRIRVDTHAIADNDVQLYMNAADLVVIPFASILNSGSVLLALSFGVPVLVPRTASMPEIRDMAGPDIVHLYDGELTPSHLASALDAARVAADRRREIIGLVREQLDWDEIARRTLSHYRDVCANRRSSRS